MINIRALASLAVAFAAGALTSPASAQSTAQVGTLACDVSGGVGMILMQKQTMTCVFTPASGTPPEPYLGRVDEFGVALGAVNEGHLVWGGDCSIDWSSTRSAVGHLRRRRRSGDRWRGCWSERARRRIGPSILAAANFSPGSDRAQPRRRGSNHHIAAAASASEEVTPRMAAARDSVCGLTVAGDDR